FGLAVFEPSLLDLHPARFDQRRVQVQSVIVTGDQVSDKVKAASQRATADIDEPVLRPEALRDQEIALQQADLVPQATHGLAVPAGGDLAGTELAGIEVSVVCHEKFPCDFGALVSLGLRSPHSLKRASGIFEWGIISRGTISRRERAGKPISSDQCL